MQTQYPDQVIIIFDKITSKFKGLKIDLRRKQNHVLLKPNFPITYGIPGEKEAMARQERMAADLIKHLLQKTDFKIPEAKDIAEEHTYALDISDDEFAGATFIAPADGGTVEDAYNAVISALKKMHATVDTGTGPQQAR